jgi:hypothetical protein
MAPRRRVPLLLLASAAALTSSSPAGAWMKSGDTYTTDGSQDDVTDAANHASPGDVVLIPAGSFTWGAKGGSGSDFPIAVTLQGAGPDKTTIQIADSAPTYGAGIINLYAPLVLRDFTVTQGGHANTTAFSTSASGPNDSTGWRITNVVYNSASTAGYFVYAGTYGLIDSCTVNAGGGSDELIFSRGPSDSWQTPTSLGTASAVYVEDCTFNNAGYVSDFNSNARGVVRFCTINGPMKVDAHGLASNTPPRGVRQMEVYDDHWTLTSGYYAAMELRGGTGVVFDNVGDNAQSDWLYLEDYGYQAQWPNFSSVFQTPVDYPISDQIGVGQDPKTAAGEPYYVWNNLLAGAPWPRTLNTPAAGAVALYDQQVGTDAGFTEPDLIQADRDFFWQGAAFDGSSGVGRGTTAQMNAIAPTRKGVGFWVTDQGSWNRKLPPGTSGQLHVWNGTAWVLAYTPYTYPHPLRHVDASADAGGGDGGSGPDDGGVGLDAGADAGGGAAGGDAPGGCACTAPASGSASGAAVGALAAFVVLGGRRRSRRASRRGARG